MCPLGQERDEGHREGERSLSGDNDLDVALAVRYRWECDIGLEIGWPSVHGA